MCSNSDFVLFFFICCFLLFISTYIKFYEIEFLTEFSAISNHLPASKIRNQVKAIIKAKSHQTLNS